MKFNKTVSLENPSRPHGQLDPHLVLSIDGISKYFGKKKSGGIVILDDIGMEIAKHKVTAIIGSNGAGKTTLFNIISGFIPADSGKITYCPNPSKYSKNQLKPHKVSDMGIGRLFQDGHIFPNLSILDNMLIAQKATSKESLFHSVFNRDRVRRDDKDKEKIVFDLFRNFFEETEDPFSHRMEHYANTLSYGQQRLLALLRLYIGQYELLLLDEPTAGVNVGIIEKMAKIIRRMPGDNYSVLLIEHNWEFVLEVADFCYFLDEGKVAAFGTPNDVLGNRRVRELYLGR